jgi:hypothetical protein
MWTDILVIQFPDEEYRMVLEMLVYLPFNHTTQLLS